MKSLRFAFIPLLLLGCGDSNKGGNDMAMTLGPAPMLAAACSDTLADVYNLPTGMPAMDDSHRGDVFRCAITESLTADQTNAQAKLWNYAGPTLPSGFWTYRIAYRSLRNTPTGGGTPAEGDMAATLLLPEKQIAGAPVVVFAHGSNGIAPSCSPSHYDLSAPVPDPTAVDFPPSLYALAGYGYTVIVPDYSGFSYGQAPGYFNAEDEAHAVLDATRAAHKILPADRDAAQVAFVGHSEGGHAILAAQHYLPAYGMHGTLVGIATWAPFDISMASWGAITTDQAGFMTATDSSAILYAMDYFYSGGELRDGPGGGLAMFQASKADGVKQTLLSSCYDTADLQKLGAKPSDFFDPTFVTDVGFSCADNTLTPDCTQGAAPTWKARWIEDRPALDPMSTVPILIWFGGMDTYIKPTLAQCVRDKFAMDLSGAGTTTKIQYCYDPNATHNSIVRDDTDFVNKWIAFKAGIGADPGACMDFPTGLTCKTPPNNF